MTSKYERKAAKIETATRVLTSRMFDLESSAIRLSRYRRKVDGKYIDCEVDDRFLTSRFECFGKDDRRLGCLDLLDLSEINPVNAMSDAVHACVAYCLSDRADRLTYLAQHYGDEHAEAFEFYADTGYYDGRSSVVPGTTSPRRILGTIQRAQFFVAQKQDPGLTLEQFKSAMYADQADYDVSSDGRVEVIVLVGGRAVELFNDGERSAEELADIGELRYLEFDTVGEAAAYEAGVRDHTAPGEFVFPRRDELEGFDRVMRVHDVPSSPSP